MRMIFPAWTTGNIIFYSCLALLVILAGPLEYKGLALMSYSKFRPSQGIPTRLGMFIIYSTPLIALVVSALSYLLHPTLIQACVFGALFIHFSKRFLETQLLHIFSGPVGIFTVLVAASFYSLAAFMIGYLNHQPLPALDNWFYLGLVLFPVGIVGNFVHHKILANLRRDKQDYFIPEGCLFRLMVCPHYLFEIITWLGIALMSRHLAAFLAVGFMLAYLSARSLRTLDWYREKFPNFPSDRKAILPFIL